MALTLAQLPGAAQSFAANAVNGTAGTILLHASESLPGLWRLTGAFCYFMGILLSVMALFKLKSASDSGGARESYSAGIWFLLIGVVFLNIPTVANTVLESLYDSSMLGGATDGHTLNVLAYSAPNIGNVRAKEVLGAVFQFIQFVGMLAFIRGWMILKATADGGGRGDASVSKGVIHIVGGIMALNAVATANMLSETMGLGITL